MAELEDKIEEVTRPFASEIERLDADFRPLAADPARRTTERAVLESGPYDESKIEIRVGAWRGAGR